MLKRPAPAVWFKNLKKIAVFAVVAETAAFGGSYLFWYRLNTNRGKVKVLQMELNIVKSSRC